MSLQDRHGIGVETKNFCLETVSSRPTLSILSLIFEIVSEMLISDETLNEFQIFHFLKGFHSIKPASVLTAFSIGVVTLLSTSLGVAPL